MAHAQRARHDVRVEAGVARIEQPGSAARSALLLGAVRHHADSTLAGLLAGNATWARDSVAAVQIIGALAWRPSPASRWQLEGGASGAAFSLVALGLNNGNISGWVRTRRQLGTHGGAMAGGTLGHTVRGSAQARSNSVEIGGWATGGAMSLELSLARARTEDSLLMAASRVFARRGSAWLDMDDAVLAATWHRGSLDLAATYRARLGTRGTDAAQSAFAGAATFALSTRAAVVVAGGRHLADPMRGAPDATTFSALMRLTFTDQSAAAPALRESDVTQARMTDGTVLVVRIRAPAHARVEVAGSFSGWQPVPVTRKGEHWEAQVLVPSGRHRVAYRIDGGEWRAPNRLARLREFGGEVGLIVVP